MGGMGSTRSRPCDVIACGSPSAGVGIVSCLCWRDMSSYLPAKLNTVEYKAEKCVIHAVIIIEVWSMNKIGQNWVRSSGQDKLPIGHDLYQIFLLFLLINLA